VILQTFEAAVRWTNHDLVKRRSQFATLIESVRLPLIAQDYLVNIGEEQLIKSNSQCKDLLIEAMRYHLMKDEQRSSFRSPRVKPRIPVGSPKVL
jgi:kelch-like protein 2/3